MQSYRVQPNDNGSFCIILANGNIVRDTNCEFWFTRDPAKAAEAVAYFEAGKPRAGAHWLKSTFGTSL